MVLVGVVLGEVGIVDGRRKDVWAELLRLSERKSIDVLVEVPVGVMSDCVRKCRRKGIEKYKMCICCLSDLSFVCVRGGFCKTVSCRRVDWESGCGAVVWCSVGFGL